MSAAILRLIQQTKVRCLVFHTALMPDGVRLVERLRPVPFVKARIEGRNVRDARPVWAVGEREAIIRLIVSRPAGVPADEILPVRSRLECPLV